MILEILEYPDTRLRTIAKPVDEVTDDLRKLIDDMFETMYDAPGIGLAATQVNVHKQIIVMDVSEDNSEPRCSSTRKLKFWMANWKPCRKAACRCLASTRM